MTSKPDVPKGIVTGGHGKYILRCPACGYTRTVYASKATAHQFAEAHRRNRKAHPKHYTGTVVDTIGTTDDVTVELTTPEDPTAA